MTLTADGIILLVIAFASFLGSILVIWAFTSKVKSSLNATIKAVLEAELEKNNKATDARISLALAHAQERTGMQISGLDEKIDTYISSAHADKVLMQETTTVLTDALIEAYKNDIRGIYYVLRSTGEITDHDKAYIDKIFPLYKALGGNSDIAAKYGEICRVVERRTQEQFDNALKKKKVSKGSAAQNLAGALAEIDMVQIGDNDNSDEHQA